MKDFPTACADSVLDGSDTEIKRGRGKFFKRIWPTGFQAPMTDVCARKNGAGYWTLYLALPRQTCLGGGGGGRRTGVVQNMPIRTHLTTLCHVGVRFVAPPWGDVHVQRKP